MITAALTASYAALVAFYHAKPKRADAAVMARLGQERLALLRWLGAALLILALGACIAAVEVARGITIWFGLVSLAAALSLTCAALRPGWHLRSVVVVVLVGVFAEFLRRLM